MSEPFCISELAMAEFARRGDSPYPELALEPLFIASTLSKLFSPPPKTAPKAILERAALGWLQEMFELLYLTTS